MNKAGNNGSEKALRGLFLMEIFRYYRLIEVWSAHSDLSEQVMFFQDGLIFVA